MPTTGAAGTTRFGDQVRNGPAASFRCGECGEIAGVVRVARASSTVGSEPRAEGWLVLEYFLGTTWHADTCDVLDAVRVLIDQGNVDPVTIREITWALWDITPFYCPECRLNYCSQTGTCTSRSTREATTASPAPARTGTDTCSADHGPLLR